MVDSVEGQKARHVLDAATVRLVSLLARTIAFSPVPASALVVCRDAARHSFGQHLPPKEREWIINYVMDAALASALEILSLGHSPGALNVVPLISATETHTEET